MKTLFLLLFSFLVATSCSSQNTFTIPALKVRVAGLAPKEFVLAKKKVGDLSAKLKKDPNDIKAYVSLSQIFMNEARVTGDHPYYYNACLSLLDEALRRSPEDLQALLSKGSVLLSLHHFADAKELGERAVKIAPASRYPWGILCDANVELGNYDEAVRDADKMTEIRPELHSYSRISYLREIYGDIPGAIEAMKYAVKAGAPGSEELAWARTTLGNLQLQQGDLLNAENQYMQALQERKDFPFALGGMARVRIAQGKYGDAYKLLDKAVKLMPEFSFVEYRANLSRATGRKKQADSLVVIVEKMLLEDEAAGHYADKEFALLYADNKIKPADAVARAKKELARRPNNIEAQHAMAYTLFRDGKAAEAKPYIDQALRTHIKNAEMIAHAGLIELALGNKERSAELLKQALSINPFLPPLLLVEVRASLASI